MTKTAAKAATRNGMATATPTTAPVDSVASPLSTRASESISISSGAGGGEGGKSGGGDVGGGEGEGGGGDGASGEGGGGGGDGGGGGGEGGGGDSGDGEGARMTTCETTGPVAPSTVTPTAALSAAKLLVRPCIESTTLLAADASAKVMVTFTLTLAALTSRLMSAGDTLR